MAARSFTTIGLMTAAVLTAGTVSSAPGGGDLVPARPGARLQALTTLSGGGAVSTPCLTPVVQSLRSDPQRASAAARRSLSALAGEVALPSERRAVDSDGNVVRFTTDRNSFDRVEILDDNANGRPDLVDAALSGLARAQRLLVGQLELAGPGPVEVVLGRMSLGIEGLSLPGSGRDPHTQVWLDPGTRGTAALRRAAEHQYAHAVAAAAGLDPAWGEAFAGWVVMALEGAPDDRALLSIGRRLANFGSGLVVDDLDGAWGNAVWFAFLHEAYGPTAVKLAVEELGRGGSDQAALDRALRRSAGDSLDAALREFQVWTLLVGPRDDRRHFSFASRLAAPAFASTAEALPALSVQADPEIGPMGAAAVAIRPTEHSGGLTVRFEGDMTARWGVDVLLVRSDGSMHRVPLELDAEDAGELTVPLQDVREATLLVRNLDPEGRPARRYTWGAQFDPGYPVVIGSLRAEPTAGDAVLVSWDTAGERGLLGFNVLRSREENGRPARVNPVWIPAVGDASVPASYSFVDEDAQPGVAYRYRVEAVTTEGLTSRSDAVALSPAP